MNSKPRIAIFIPSLVGGGVERVMTVLSAGFVDRGHPVDLVLARAHGHLMNEVDPRVRVVDLNRGRVLASLRPLAGYLRETRPACLLAGMAHANLVAIAARRISGCKCRLVVGTHNYFSTSSAISPRFLDRLTPPLARWLYPRADCAAAVSSDVARDLVSTIGLREDFVHMIPNPVDIQRAVAGAREPADHPFFRLAHGPVLVAVGRFVPEKGFDVLLRALPRVRESVDAKLVILGEGSQRNALEALVDELQLREHIALPGFVDNPFSFMAAAAALVAPSRLEGFGNVLVEAMACGTPVVATDCPGGPSEILQDGRYGPVVETGWAGPLAEAILSTLADPTDPEILRRRADDFAREKVVDRYLEVLLGVRS
jgi:glycosyltransferase involved in cell wall biosynthesis